MLARQLTDRFQRHPLRQAILQKPLVHAEMMLIPPDGKKECLVCVLSAADVLGVGDAFDQGGAFAAEGGAALVFAALAGGGDLGL